MISISPINRPRLFFVFLSLVSLFTPSFHVKATGNNNLNKSAMAWRTTGPTGGDVRSLVVDPKDSNRFFFGTLDGQIYTSNDACRTWSLFANFNRPRLYVDNIIIDSRDSNIMYVATHRHKESGGLYITKDGGKKWREISALKNEAIHAMIQSPTSPDILLAGTVSGVFRSMDSGETWERINKEGVNPYTVESLAIDPRNPNVIIAGTWYRPYKTTDGGKSWRLIKEGMIDDSDVFALDIDENNPDHIFASACSGIYESWNGGEKWSKIGGIPSQARRTRAILIHPTTQSIVLAGTTEGFWRTGDGGKSWMVTTSRQLEINAITVHRARPDFVYIATNNYGVMVSNDSGRTFVPTNEGYSGRFANSILVDRENPNRVYSTTINTTTGGGFFFISNDGGINWQASMRNLPNRIVMYSIFQDEQNANTIYLATDNGVYRSLDRGASWSLVGPPKAKTSKSSKASTKTKPVVAANPTVKQAQEALNKAGYNVGVADGKLGAKTLVAIKKFQTDKGLPSTGKLDKATLTALGLKVATESGNERVTSLTMRVQSFASTFDERDGKTGILAATVNGLYRTYDIEKGWEKLPYPMDIALNTMCVTTSLQTPTTIWAGTATSGLIVSKDAGTTWQRVEGVPSIAPINVIVQDPQNPARIFVGTAQTFYRSFNNGETWERRGGYLPYGNYTSILINPKNGDEIYVGSSDLEQGGVYRTTNGGTMWTKIESLNGELPSKRIWALSFDQKNPRRIFVASHSAGVYIAESQTESAMSTH
jgi:photosystem II stability/assembly factor-like uncharacterized protein